MVMLLAVVTVEGLWALVVGVIAAPGECGYEYISNSKWKKYDGIRCCSNVIS